MNGQPAQHIDINNNGHLIDIAEDECEAINLRVLTQCTSHVSKNSFFTPREKRLELIFFRDIFGRLAEQLERSVTQSAKESFGDGIPIEEFPV